jgi:peptide/nickel transport system substrate-binding protein
VKLFAIAVLALAIVASACGDSGDAGTSTTTSSRTPDVGGVLTFAEYSEPAGLDPIVSTGQGTTGAIEMAAVYDTLMRFDPDTGAYEPRIAESVSSNSDATVWTVKLRPNVKFSDGTPYDANAVILAWNRHRSGAAGAPPCAEIVACPRNPTSSNVYMSLIKDLEAPDALTVKATLKEPWSGFAHVLASEPSMVPSPAALRRCDASKPAAQCEFNLKPVGAGPFLVESFKPKDSITMVRNPNYWGGQVYLDGLRFVNFGDVGGPKSYDAFKSGAVQAAFLRQPDVVAQAHADKAAGFSTMQNAGLGYLMNMGVTVNCVGAKPVPTCEGKPDGPTATNPPTKDLKVRRAVAAALDPKVIDQRANNGKGHAGSQLLQDDFRWAPGVPGPKYDPELAKKLVAEAKSAGWDGKLRVLENNSPQRQAAGLATQTLLQAVGIDVVLDVSKDSTGQIAQVTTAKDFDLAGWGFATSPDEGATWALAQNFSSTSSSNRVGYKNAVVDQALKDLLVARTDSEKKAGFTKVVEQVYTDLPYVAWLKVEEFTVHSPKVHGIVPTNRTSFFFDKAWIEK